MQVAENEPIPNATYYEHPEIFDIDPLKDWSILAGRYRPFKDHPEIVADAAKRLGDLDSLPYSRRFARAALVALELCELVQPDEEIGRRLTAAVKKSEGLLAAEEAEEVKLDLEAVMHDDLVREAVGLRVAEASVLADRYRQPENFSSRQELLRRTERFNDSPGLRQIKVMGSSKLLGAVTFRSSGDILRILASQQEDLAFPPLASHLHNVE